MRIEVRDSNRRRVSSVEIDERTRPARVQLPAAEGRASAELHPHWDEAVDDSGSLRRCVICGCPDLYTRKSLPQVTPFILVLAFSGVAVAALGYATNPIVNALLIVLLVLDALALVFARRQIVCYACGAVYDRVRIARYLRPWDRTVADRVAAQPADLPTVLIEPEQLAAEARLQERARGEGQRSGGAS